jgi:hypothetical protein
VAAQILECSRFGEHDQLAAGGANEIGWEAFARLTPLEDGFGTLVLEALDHGRSPTGRHVS